MQYQDSDTRFPELLYFYELSKRHRGFGDVCGSRYYTVVSLYSLKIFKYIYDISLFTFGTCSCVLQFFAAVLVLIRLVILSGPLIEGEKFKPGLWLFMQMINTGSTACQLLS